jgi:hypothetical protein
MNALNVWRGSVTPSEKKRSKMKAYWAVPENRKAACGINNPMSGRSHSEETKLKMSVAMKAVHARRKDEQHISGT